MSIRVASSSLISGAVVVGDPGHGVLGSLIPATGEHGAGYAYSSLELPADASKEIRGLITTWPTLGTLFAFEDTSFTYDGESDTFAWQMYVDGVAVGSPQTVTLSVGDVEAGASGELHATISDITATLTGTAGGAGVSGELHATLSDVTASIAGASTASGELHAATSDVIATLAGYVTITGELHAAVSDIIASITGASLGPAGVDIDIVKRWCRIDGSEFDTILPMMIESAIAIAEQETGRDYHAEEMPAAVLQFVCAHVSYWINTPDAALEKSMMPSPFVARLLDPYRLWEMT